MLTRSGLQNGKAKCVKIDEGQTGEKGGNINESMNSLPLSRATIARWQHMTVTEKGLLKDFDEAANEWQDNKRNFDLQRLEDIRRFLATDTAPEDALKMTINATPFPVRIPRICALNIDEERRMIFLEITVPAATNIDFVQTRQLASSTKKVSVPKREQSNWYNILIYSILVRAAFDVANSTYATSSSL